MKKIICVLCLCVVLLTCTGCAASNQPTEEATVATTVPTEAAVATVPTEPESKEMSLPDLAEYVQKRTVTIKAKVENGESTGSGFFIDDEGTLITNYHVIDAADSIEVMCHDGGTYSVQQIVDFSEMYDIAVLKLDISGNDYLEFAEEKVRTGESVYAVGSSIGILTGTFSDGIVSNTSRVVGVIDCIQTTAAISSGNSGGPLVNAKGEVVGVNAFTYTGGEGLHLAVKIEELDMLAMDKNWTINRFREWYKKEIDRSYKVWNYTEKEWELSKINTYQYVTEQPCFASTYDWNFLEGDFEDVVEGYDDGKGVFFYYYKESELDMYTEYLNDNGFVFETSEDYTEGISYFYNNEFTGQSVDIFILEGDEYVIIEPYSN